MSGSLSGAQLPLTAYFVPGSSKRPPISAPQQSKKRKLELVEAPTCNLSSKKGKHKENISSSHTRPPAKYTSASKKLKGKPRAILQKVVESSSAADDAYPTPGSSLHKKGSTPSTVSPEPRIGGQNYGVIDLTGSDDVPPHPPRLSMPLDRPQMGTWAAYDRPTPVRNAGIAPATPPPTINDGRKCSAKLPLARASRMALSTPLATATRVIEQLPTPETSVRRLTRPAASFKSPFPRGRSPDRLAHFDGNDQSHSDLPNDAGEWIPSSQTQELQLPRFPSSPFLFRHSLAGKSGVLQPLCLHTATSAIHGPQLASGNSRDDLRPPHQSRSDIVPSSQSPDSDDFFGSWHRKSSKPLPSLLAYSKDENDFSRGEIVPDSQSPEGRSESSVEDPKTLRDQLLEGITPSPQTSPITSERTKVCAAPPTKVLPLEDWSFLPTDPLDPQEIVPTSQSQLERELVMPLRMPKLISQEHSSRAGTVCPKGSCADDRKSQTRLEDVRASSPIHVPNPATVQDHPNARISRASQENRRFGLDATSSDPDTSPPRPLTSSHGLFDDDGSLFSRTSTQTRNFRDMFDHEPGLILDKDQPKLGGLDDGRLQPLLPVLLEAAKDSDVLQCGLEEDSATEPESDDMIQYDPADDSATEPESENSLLQIVARKHSDLWTANSRYAQRDVEDPCISPPSPVGTHTPRLRPSQLSSPLWPQRRNHYDENSDALDDISDTPLSIPSNFDLGTSIGSSLGSLPQEVKGFLDTFSQ